MLFAVDLGPKFDTLYHVTVFTIFRDFDVPLLYLRFENGSISANNRIIIGARFILKIFVITRYLGDTDMGTSITFNIPWDVPLEIERFSYTADYIGIDVSTTRFLF